MAYQELMLRFRILGTGNLIDTIQLLLTLVIQLWFGTDILYRHKTVKISLHVILNVFLLEYTYIKLK